MIIQKKHIHRNYYIARLLLNSRMEHRKIYDYIQFEINFGFTNEEMFDECDLTDMTEYKNIPTDAIILPVDMSIKSKKIYKFRHHNKCFAITNKNYINDVIPYKKLISTNDNFNGWDI